MPASIASASVLVKLPLCPSAKPAGPTERYTGWALCQVLEPVVEYRVCPRARSPCKGERVRSSKTAATRPMSFVTVMVSPSLTAIPQDSCPRCCNANSPSKVSWATRAPGA